MTKIKPTEQDIVDFHINMFIHLLRGIETGIIDYNQNSDNAPPTENQIVNYITNIDIDIEYNQIVDFKAKSILDVPLWKIVEANGKYKVDYISSGIWQIANQLDNNNYSNIKPSQIERFLKEHLSENECYYLEESDIYIKNIEDCKVQLDHVTPRKIIIKEILELKNDEDIKKFLKEKYVGCIVLKDEHKKLNDDYNKYDKDDLWKRYKDANIAVYDRSVNNWVEN